MAALARPIGDLSFSGMIRFIMHWTLSPGWIDTRGPPGCGVTGVRHAQYGTRTRRARNMNRGLLGNPSTKRSSHPPLLGIISTPVEGACGRVAQFARDLIGISARLQDRIAGDFDAGQ